MSLISIQYKNMILILYKLRVNIYNVAWEFMKKIQDWASELLGLYLLLITLLFPLIFSMFPSSLMLESD